MDYVLILAGVACLYFGGEWLVRGAISLASRLGLPAFLISLTVVGFGTSMPELLVSVRAALSGAPDIALGNVIGSNTANILLIIGLSALVWPIAKTARQQPRDILVMIAAAAVLTALMLTGTITRLAGFGMLAFLAAYLFYAYRTEKDAHTGDDDLGMEPMTGIKTTIFLIAGLALLFVGADMLVRGATSLARQFGISEAVIGLTIVAVGTSLPELATSIVAALRRHSDIAIGNVVGSNIFNILGILGVTAAIIPVPAAQRMVTIDAPVMLVVTLVFAAILFAHRGVPRWLGGLLVGAYAIYAWLLLA